MAGERRAKKIEEKAEYYRKLLTGIPNAPVNVSVRIQIYSLLWFFKQKYHNPDNPLYYMSKKSYEKDLHKVSAIEEKITQGQFDEERAREAVQEAKEYLIIVAGNRVNNCRVY